MKNYLMFEPSAQDDLLLVMRWRELRSKLIEAGAEVNLVPGDKQEVSIRKLGFMLHHERTTHYIKSVKGPQQAALCSYLDAHGCVVMTLNNKLSGEDVLFSTDKKHLWLGIGPNTDFAVKRELDEIVDSIDDTIVRPLILTDARFKTLSSCFCPLDSGELLWYPDAFNRHSRMIIESWYCDKIIAVSEEDAINGVCSSISVGRTLIVPAPLSLDLQRQLLDGYVLDEMPLAGKSLTTEINE